MTQIGLEDLHAIDPGVDELIADTTPLVDEERAARLMRARRFIGHDMARTVDRFDREIDRIVAARDEKAAVAQAKLDAIDEQLIGWFRHIRANGHRGKTFAFPDGDVKARSGARVVVPAGFDASTLPAELQRVRVEVDKAAVKAGAAAHVRPNDDGELVDTVTGETLGVSIVEEDSYSVVPAEVTP